MRKTFEVFLRTPYNYDTNAASDESGLACQDESRTKQSFAEEADINTIVRRFGVTGQLPTGIRAPTYGDFENVVDFHTAMNAIAQAGEAFDRMPAQVRARFHNNPAEFVDFCSDPANVAEMEKLGLTNTPKNGATSPVEATPEGKKVSPSPVTASNELGNAGDSGGKG